MDIHLLTALFSLSALVACVASQTCEQSRYEGCLKQLIEFTDRGDLLFASSHDELRQECVQAQSSLGCLTRYSKKCLADDEERTKFNDGITGPQKITMALCTDMDFRSRYIGSIPCLRNMSEGLQYCKEKYDRNQKDIILVEYEDKTHLQCCSFDGYRRCLRMLLETNEECRESTSGIVDEIAIRVGGVFSEDLCAEHFKRCTGSSAAPLQLRLSHLLIALAPFATAFLAIVL